MSDSTWTTIELRGHPCHIYEPAQPGADDFVVIYLHDVDLAPLSKLPQFVQQFDRHGLRVVCPVTRRSWWADRTCPEFDAEITAEQYVVQHMLELVNQRWGSRPPQLALLGTGMGGQGALRLSYKYPNLFPIVAGIAPALDYHLLLEAGIDDTLPLMYHDPEDARQDTAILHIHPLNWPRHQFFCCDPMDLQWWNSADRLRMKLRSLGVPHECDLETEAGAGVGSYDSHMVEVAVRFLVERLEEERRRVV